MEWGGEGTCVLVLFMWNIIDTDRWERQETFTLIHDKHSYIGVPSRHKKKANMTVFGEPRQATAICRGQLGNRDKRVLPCSANATNFKVRGGRYRRLRQKCRPLRRPLQKSVADFGDRDFGKCDKKVRPLSPKSARAVRGMV